MSPSQMDTAQQESVSISEAHQRLFFTLDRLVELIPPDAKDHPMAKLMTTFIRESKKDIKRFPEDKLVDLSRKVGEAFCWVADGDINDINAPEDEIELPVPESVDPNELFDYFNELSEDAH